MSDQNPETSGIEETVDAHASKHPVLRGLVFVLLAAVLGSFLTLVVGNWIVMPLVVYRSTTQVPDLYGIDVGVAKRELVSLDLVFVNDSTDYVADELIPANHIVSQDPSPYSEVKSGRRVHVVISRGPRPQPVPNVVNSGALEAKLRLNRAHLKLGRLDLRLRSRDERSDPYVLSQDPAAGTLVARGDSVYLAVSIAPVVPDLRNRSYDSAKAILHLLGLRVGSVTYRSDDRILPYSVVEQSVRPGSMATAGQSVNLVLSRL